MMAKNGAGMRRIEANASVEELQLQYQRGVDDPEILGEMLASLSGRQTQRASDLRGKLITRLSQLQVQIPEVSRPRADTLLRPPDAPDLPPAIPQPAGRRTELNLKKDATWAEKHDVALQALIAELQNSRSRRSRPLTQGQRQPGLGQTFIYSFQMEDTSSLVDDASVQIEVKGTCHDVVIVSLPPGRIVISIATDLGAELPRARLLLDDTALLSQLRERIGDIGRQFLFNHAMADALLDNTPRLPAITPLKDSRPTVQLDTSQARARERVRTQPLTYIWGPPGCGKTYTLAEIVRMAFVAQQRILICSNTNKAVDQLLHEVCKQLQAKHAPALEAGQVIRLGNIVDDQL